MISLHFLFASFGTGATGDIDATSATAVCISGLIIFTTIHAQDFADVEGDAALGRMTFPIYAPSFSRSAMLFTMSSCSLFLACFWGVGPLCGTAFITFGSFVGRRYYYFRVPEDDRFSYALYNVSGARLCPWLVVTYCLPTPPGVPQTYFVTTSTGLAHYGPHHALSCTHGEICGMI